MILWCPACVPVLVPQVSIGGNTYLLKLAVASGTLALEAIISVVGSKLYSKASSG